MLTGSEYADLDNALREQRGFRLLTTSEQYSEARYLPNAYAHLKGSTPETVWTNGANIPAAWELYEAWSRPAAVVKDYVKSAKHKWREACYLPAKSDRTHFESVLNALLAYRGTDFAGGFVLRRFAPLRQIGETSFGQPEHKEHRLFFGGGECFCHAPFVREPDYTENIAV